MGSKKTSVLNPPTFIQEPLPLKRLILEVYNPILMVQYDRRLSTNSY